MSSREQPAPPPASADPEERAELAELAKAYGIDREYVNWRGDTTPVPDDTLVAALRAFDVDATGQRARRDALTEARRAPWRRALPPAVVARRGSPARVAVRAPRGRPMTAWVELEDGRIRRDLHRSAVSVDPVEVDGVLLEETPIEVPEGLPLGWHRLYVRVGSPPIDAGDADGTASTPLVIAPAYLGLPDVLAGRRTWGLMIQLYSIRSRRSWEVGDLSDLADLAGFAARDKGAGFVLVNPLHAGNPVSPLEPSPYFPASRRFTDPLYLRVEDIPEFGELTESDRDRVRTLGAPLHERSRGTRLLDRDAAWEAKRAALELIFAAGLRPERAAAFDGFRAREGAAMLDFATWCALAERYGLPWQSWPTELHDPRSPEVGRARDEMADRVDFYCWLQWLLDEQLGGAQRAAESAGMPIGVLHDLAVGVSPGGADAWRLGDVLAPGVTTGAPPDSFNQQGQDWGLPPWRPDRLAEAGYAPYRDMLRAVLRHSGGVRIDHILGLFRLWWIPEGVSPGAGAYIRYDYEALVGILALEAHRAGALVVGEDLGTVEPWVRDYLAGRGILGTSTLWFEKEKGAPRPPKDWRELCLGTVGTHDMPPIAGYLAGEHIELRDRLGLLRRPAEAEREDADGELRAWLAELRVRGLLPDSLGETRGTDDADAIRRDGAARWAVVTALHAFVALTPAKLVGIAVTDAVGEPRTQNQPGTTTEYPNWRVPLADGAGRAVTLEDVMSSGGLAELAGVVSARTDPTRRRGQPFS